MSVRRSLLVWSAFLSLDIDLYLLVEGRYELGGGLMIVGGFCVMIAARSGWTEFWEGLSNWLLLRR